MSTEIKIGSTDVKKMCLAENNFIIGKPWKVCHT